MTALKERHFFFLAGVVFDGVISCRDWNDSGMCGEGNIRGCACRRGHLWVSVFLSAVSL